MISVLSFSENTSCSIVVFKAVVNSAAPMNHESFKT